jgi:group I intron endonuclease
MNRPSGVYQIQSKIKPERIYIGSAVSILQRWGLHLKGLGKGTHHSSKLQNHVNKYGIDDLSFSIIEPCLPEWLTTREQYYLNKLKPYFNICRVAGSVFGIKRSKESIEKRLETMKGHKVSDETREKMSAAKKGKVGPRLGSHPSEETKQKLRDANLGLKHPGSNHFMSEERRKQIGEFHKGNKYRLGKGHSAETKLKISIAQKGRKLSEERRQRMSIAKKKQYQEHPVSKEIGMKISLAKKGKKIAPMSEATRIKIGLAHRGLKRSPEARKKMSEIAKKREELKRLKKQINNQEASICN